MMSKNCLYQIRRDLKVGMRKENERRSKEERKLIKISSNPRQL